MKFQGRTIINGHARGPLLMTDHAMNFTAAFTKVPNFFKSRKAEVRDRHHPWFKTNIKGRVIVIPAAIGSTHTGLVLLDLVRLQDGPAAIIVDHADSLLVSGIVLSEVWYDRAIPVIEYPTAELREKLKDGEMAEVDGETGEIRVGA
ncbi:DUF126 domain-containing protein [Candidatus Sumerlaeota bacterium]|nr:DUF126 domain-containing protein [Candidatus Sumerlaeota bacterium]MBI3736704.1 DUF126 domain-containing protein [Candidatus Sumerlaeota bacterium]